MQGGRLHSALSSRSSASDLSRNFEMKRKYIEPAVLGVVLLTTILLAAYPYLRGSKAATTEMNDNTKVDDRHYSTDLKMLRDRFNQDKGKVRLILLLSPT